MVMVNGAGVVGQKLLGAIKAHAGIAAGVGIALILAGVLAICAPFVAGVSVMLMIGGLLLIGGIALCLLALRVGAFGPGMPLLLMGVLMILTGLYMFTRPIEALASMTLLLAAYLIVTGIVEIFAGFGARPEPGWGWMVASAVVTLLLGLMLWRQFPISGVWAIGTLFGIKLLMTGISMTSIGMTVRGGVRGVQSAMKS
jgi:uncharacterized membrane protein HdeD (DUF308 family)